MGFRFVSMGAGSFAAGFVDVLPGEAVAGHQPFVGDNLGNGLADDGHDAEHGEGQDEAGGPGDRCPEVKDQQAEHGMHMQFAADREGQEKEVVQHPDDKE